MAEQLPINDWRSTRDKCIEWTNYLPEANAWGVGGWKITALTPHAPAQSALDELRREVEALRADRDKLRDRLTMLRNHTSVNENQIAMIDEALDTARASTDEGVGK